MSADPDIAAPRSGAEILLTAEEAFPALERAFLAARQEIALGFRIFDPDTRLRSPEALALGNRWSDLIAATLARGVSIRLLLSDFDPIGASDLHRSTWRSMHEFEAIRERTDAGAQLDVHASMHPAVAGLLPRLLFYPVVQKKLAARAADINGLGAEPREQALREMPGLAACLESGKDGTVRPRRWPPPDIHPVTHHQKVAVFDRELLLIGGLDLNDRRWDTKDHERSAAATWHDIQIAVRGQAAEEAGRHLDELLAVARGEAQPQPRHRLVTTLSAPRRRRTAWTRIGPRTVDRSIAEAHHRLIGSARSLIYLETQFFRDLRLAWHLADAARRRPELGLLLVLPAAPEQVAFSSETRLADRFGEWLQGRCLRRLIRAFGPRFFAASPAQPRSVSGDGRDTLNGAPLVYVHAKVSCFDLDAAIVSSANLNGRSLRWDTEAGVVIDSKEDVRRLRGRIFRHWLGPEAGPKFFEGPGAVAAWRELAVANAHAEPKDRRGFLMPYDIDAAERFGQAVPGVPEEMV